MKKITFLFAIAAILISAASCGQRTNKQTTNKETMSEQQTTKSENLYANIPDKMFPIPMRNGEIIPYSEFSPPEEGYEVTTYIYTGVDFMDSYKKQLRKAGFVDQGGGEWIESLWRYDRKEDGATLMVELFREGNKFAISMYVNYLNN